LFKPERKLPQRLRIREQDQNAFAALAFENKLNECGDERRIFEKVLPRLLGAFASAIHQPINIEAQKRGGQCTDRSEDTETAAEVGRDLKRRIAFLTRDGQQITI